MSRRLVTIRKIVEDAEERGEDLDTIYVDPDDIVEIDEDTEEA